MSDLCSRSATGLLVSGGLDSCILLGHLLRRGQRVQPLFIRLGLIWETEELAAAKRFCRAVAAPALEEFVELDLPVADLYEGHWSLTGAQVPDASSAAEAVYLPGRNALLLVKAALWCQLHGIERIALGVLGSNPFADATPEFFADLQAALNFGAPLRIHIERPFGHLDKRQVMELGRELPLEMTFSCLAPIEGLHCGLCNKCAERKAAFRSIATEDPTIYAAAGVLGTAASPMLK